MNVYLQPVDYILLAAQAVLGVLLGRCLYRQPLAGLCFWAYMNTALAGLWAALAFTVTAERFGNWAVRAQLFEGLVLAFSVVEISALLLPFYRNKVWQRGAGCIAVALIVIGIVGPHTALLLYYAETMVMLGAAFIVLLFCTMLAGREAAGYALARAVCGLLAGQALTAQLPVFLGCATPECLVQPTWAAFFVRRAMPFAYVCSMAYILMQANKRSVR